MPLSIAAQMRAAKARGMTVSQIAKLFGKSYHYVYANVVRRAGAAPQMQPPVPQSVEDVGIEGVADDALFELAAGAGGGKLGARRRWEAEGELNRRYPVEADYWDAEARWKASLASRTRG